MEKILAKAHEVTPERDSKLQILKQVIRDKAENPKNAENRKVLVFSAYADTASYLYSHLAQWANDEVGLYSGPVTGGTFGNKTNLPGCSNDFNNIIVIR